LSNNNNSKHHLPLLRRIIIDGLFIIIPYGIGRELGYPYLTKNFLPSNNGELIISSLPFNPESYFLFGYIIVILGCAILIDIVWTKHVVLIRRLGLFFVALIQFLGGFGYIKVGLTERVELVFGSQSDKIINLDYGMLLAFFGFLFYIIIFLILLIFTKSPIQEFNRSEKTIWIFAGIEIIFLILYLLGYLKLLFNLFV